MMSSARYLRSRTGCWTCRFRKKKCDEILPICGQCQHLNLTCDNYMQEQPIWMKDDEAAKKKKEDIKAEIGKPKRRRRRTAALEGNGDVLTDHSSKEQYQSHPPLRQLRALAPATPTISTPKTGTKTPSSESDEFSDETDADNYTSATDGEEPGWGSIPHYTIEDRSKRSLGLISPTLPHEVQPKSTRMEETGYPWSPGLTHSSKSISSNYSTPDRVLSPEIRTSSAQFLQEPYVASLRLSSSERGLLTHFLDRTLPLIYRGTWESDYNGLIRQWILSPCASDISILYAHLSSSALHLSKRSSSSVEQATLEQSALRYRGAALAGLREQLSRGVSDLNTVFALIGSLVMFESHSDYGQWQAHIGALVDCVTRCGLPNKTDPNSRFVTARTMWMDIMSSCTLAKAPYLWEHYRRLLSAEPRELQSYGIIRVCGCADEILFLISELMCFEECTRRAIAEGDYNWERVKSRSIQLDERFKRSLGGLPTLQITGDMIASAFSHASGNIGNIYSSPGPSNSTIPSSTESTQGHKDEYTTPTVESSSTTISAAYRTAARIQLWSISLGVHPRLELFQRLLNELMKTIKAIPGGQHGYDRCILWPILIGGSFAVFNKDREFFLSRCRPSGRTERFGNIQFVEKILLEVWRRQDHIDMVFGGKDVRWREVMRDLNLELLLI